MPDDLGNINTGVSPREPEFTIYSERDLKRWNKSDLPEVQRQTEVFTDMKKQVFQRFGKKGTSQVSESSRKSGDIKLL